MILQPSVKSSVPWYDRNPQAGGIEYEIGSSAPSGITVRASIVVPALRKMKVGAFTSRMYRYLAGNSNDTMKIYARVTLADASIKTLAMNYIYNLTNLLERTVDVNLNVFLSEGDTLEIVTHNTITGGYVTVNASIAYTLFDA